MQCFIRYRFWLWAQPVAGTVCALGTHQDITCAPDQDPAKVVWAEGAYSFAIFRGQDRVTPWYFRPGTHVFGNQTAESPHDHKLHVFDDQCAIQPKVEED